LRRHLVIGHDRHPRLRRVRSEQRARRRLIAIKPAKVRKFWYGIRNPRNLIEPLARGLCGDLFIFAQEGRQLTQMMGEQNLRRRRAGAHLRPAPRQVAHARRPRPLLPCFHVDARSNLRSAARSPIRSSEQSRFPDCANTFPVLSLKIPCSSKSNSLFRCAGNFSLIIRICYQIRTDFLDLGKRFREIPGIMAQLPQEFLGGRPQLSGHGRASRYLP
jgi:hypothetical protein